MCQKWTSPRPAFRLRRAGTCTSSAPSASSPPLAHTHAHSHTSPLPAHSTVALPLKLPPPFPRAGHQCRPV
eukprot:scaffold22789_cov64-Isochrysis_galbana.AAC.1